MSFLRSNDAAIYYEEYGTGEPLILLPGLLGTIESHWRRFIPDLSTHFHTIAVDLRGHGRTNNPSGVLHLNTLINDLRILLDSLQIERAYVCGYSLGGYIGLAYGVQFPDTILGLVLHATKVDWTPEAIQATRLSLNPETIQTKVPAWGQALRKDHEPANGETGWMNLVRSSAEFIGEMKPMDEQLLLRARFPVLVSLCENDEMIPRTEAENLAQLLPNARFALQAGCKHPFQSVQRDPFIEEAVAFLKSIPLTR